MKLKTWSCLSIVCLLSSASFAAPSLIKAQQQIEEYQLENGLKLILAPNAKENKVYMNTIYFTGSLNDPQGKGGLAHLLEHLAFKGTKTISSEQFKSRLDQYTLSNNASTDYYSTQYTNILRPEAKALNEIIYLEAQRMAKLNLQKKFIPTEIEIVKREREVRLDQPFSVLVDQVLKAAYGNQALGRLPIGDLNELQSIGLKDLEKFYRQWYLPNNAAIVISGKFDKEQVLAQVDQQFGSIPAGKVPMQAQVPSLDPQKISVRQFEIKKGSDLVQVNTYLNTKDKNKELSLSLLPALYNLEPSGVLYQNMVKTGVANAVSGSTWLDQDFDLVYFGAVYGTNHDAKQVQQQLTQQVENVPEFEQSQLTRLKNAAKNGHESIEQSASAFGAVLTSYVVGEKGNWAKYFSDKQRLEALSLTQIQQDFQSFLNRAQRIQVSISPTPEEEKKAKAASQTPKLTEQNTAKAEPLKDVAEYQQDIQQYLNSSQQAQHKNEAKIQRGQLNNGLRYALFPTTTQNDKVYASIEINFADDKQLFGQAEQLDLMAYLLLRGSKQQSLQQLQDKAIEVGGSASVNRRGNGLAIDIVAKKQHFAEYFDYVIQALKQPSFAQDEFDLVQKQMLSLLERPYTEPDTVAGLALARTIERYPLGDLRAHTEPEHLKAQLNAAKRSNIVELYQKYVAMNHAYVAVTGEFDAQQMQQQLQRNLGNWNHNIPFTRLSREFQQYPAQQRHAIAEAREFGSYQAILKWPVGHQHADIPALQVFRHVLADSQLSSRLAQALREQNALVYGFSAHSNFDEWTEHGALSISANYSSGKAAWVSQLVKQVLTELVNNGITEQELAEAKATLLKKRATALDDERRIHGYLIAQLEHGTDLPYRAKRDQAIAALTKAEVDAAIQKYIKLEHLVEVMADQYGSEEIKLK